MGERKVLTKYYPPDFDPSKLPRIKKDRDKDNAVRFMLPMSIRCEKCGEFMGEGLKFNARKSNTDENYLGIKIHRFSMRCKSCPATFTIKTDPKNGDYVCESGAKRNFQPWKAEKEHEDEVKAKREEAEQDTIVALESKTVDSKKELDDLDALHELRTVKNRQALISADDVLSIQRESVEAEKLKAERDIENAFEYEAQLAFAHKRNTVRRLNDSRNSEGDRFEKNLLGSVSLPISKKPRSRNVKVISSILGGVKIKRKESLPDENQLVEKGTEPIQEAQEKPKPPKTLASSGEASLPGLVTYGSSDSSDGE